MTRNLLLWAVFTSAASSCLIVVDVGGRGSSATDAGSDGGGGGAVCTSGDDQFCNGDETISALGGECVDGRCRCLTPFVFNSAGRCIPPISNGCTVGDDQTCNANQSMSALAGHCVAGACECIAPFMLDGSGRCAATLAGTCTLGRDETCNEDVSVSSTLGTCTSAGCSCGANAELNALSGKCRARARDCYFTPQGPCEGACVKTEGRSVCANNAACVYHSGLRITQAPSSVKALLVGTTFTIKWRAENRMNTLQTDHLALDFTSVVGSTANAWKSGATIDPPVVSFERDSYREVTATIRVPVDAVSARVTLRGEEPIGTIRATSVPIELEVGKVPQLSDARLLMFAPEPWGGSVVPDGPITGNLIDVGTGCLGGYQFGFNSSGQIPINLSVSIDPTSAGDYFFSAAFEPSAGPFVIDGVYPTQHLNVLAGDQIKSISLALRHIGASLTPTVTFVTVRAEHRPLGSATTDFTSYIRFPIQISN